LVFHRNNYKSFKYQIIFGFPQLDFEPETGRAEFVERPQSRVMPDLQQIFYGRVIV